MSKLIKGITLGLTGLAVCFMAGCATMPGGVAASSTPLEGRSYQILKCTGGDALIEVTVEGYSQYWILFTRDVTRVEGIAIRFTK